LNGECIIVLDRRFALVVGRIASAELRWTCVLGKASLTTQGYRGSDDIGISGSYTNTRVWAATGRKAGLRGEHHPIVYNVFIEIRSIEIPALVHSPIKGTRYISATSIESLPKGHMSHLADGTGARQRSLISG
jgi:hypothetical protein